MFLEKCIAVYDNQKRTARFTLPTKWRIVLFDYISSRIFFVLLSYIVYILFYNMFLKA